MSNKLNSQFLQSFIVIFFITVLSNIIYHQGNRIFHSFSNSFQTKEITPQVAEDIQSLIYDEIISESTEPVGVFFYQDDYSSRIKFDSNAIVSSPIINDVKEDSEYSKMLDYHLFNLCYEQDVASMSKDSSLYTAYLSLNQSLNYPGYYTSCPILAEDKLVGYIGTFYYLNGPTRPSIRVSRLKHLSFVIGQVLDPYF